MSDPLLGQTLAGRYRIDALLGSGGMGSVYRAHQLVLETDVAIKVLSADRAGDEDALERFRREAKNASKLDHPNLVPVTDFGQLEDGRLYLAMPLIEGTELHIKKDEPLAIDRAVEIAAQILDGLTFAHAMGLVHRDLKPENVILQMTPNGEERARLLDFGIALNARAAASESRLTKANLVFGTPLYMSPEQAGGGTVDARSDQYSVGIILFQMLSGRLPFESTSPADILRMHLVEPPPELPDSVPEPLREVVRRMLGKSRRERFDDAEAAATALRDAIEGKTVVAGAAVLPSASSSASPVPVPPQASAKRPLALYVTPLVALALGGGIWMALAPDPVDDDRMTPLPDLEEPGALPEPPPKGEPAHPPKKKKSRSGRKKSAPTDPDTNIDLPSLDEVKPADSAAAPAPTAGAAESTTPEPEPEPEGDTKLPTVEDPEPDDAAAQAPAPDEPPSDEPAGDDAG